MDTKKDITITLAKYTAYTGIILAIFFEKTDTLIISVVLCSFLITVGSIRQFAIEAKYEYLKKYTFIIDLIIVTALGFLGYKSIFVIGYYIIMVESILVCPYILGTIIAAACYFCYFGVYWRLDNFHLMEDANLFVLYNSLSFVFFYFISMSTKRQLEQKEQLLLTVDKLEKSKLDLETAYEILIQGNKKIQEVTILEERNRVAREIHDTLAHTLTTIIVEIEAGTKLMQKGSDKAYEELIKAQNQARVGLDEVRYSIKNLRSGILNREGFKGALAMTLDQLKATNDVKIILEIDESIEINDEYEMTLFRIIQEAATNSFRHGKSKNLFINVEKLDNNIMLKIADDGIGCNQIKAGYGILGIRERTKKLGGNVELESAIGNGFRITVLLPIEQV
jgi:signal transduction histidine kinase